MAASISPAFYAFVYHEDGWKARVCAELANGFDYAGSWRATYITHMLGHCAPSSPIVLKNFYSDALFQPVRMLIACVVSCSDGLAESL